MLVLSRKKDEKIVIGDKIAIMVVDIQGDKVRLGIEAPREVSVHREEVYQEILRKQREGDPLNTAVGSAGEDEIVSHGDSSGGGYDPSTPFQPTRSGGGGRGARHRR